MSRDLFDLEEPAPILRQAAAPEDQAAAAPAMPRPCSSAFARLLRRPVQPGELPPARLPGYETRTAAADRHQLAAVVRALAHAFVDDLDGDERPLPVGKVVVRSIYDRRITAMSIKRSAFVCRRDELPAEFFTVFLNHLARESDGQDWQAGHWHASYYHVDILGTWLDDYNLTLPADVIPDRIEYAVDSAGKVFVLARAKDNDKRIAVYPTRLLPVVITPAGIRLQSGQDLTALVSVERIVHAAPGSKAITLTASNQGGDHAALYEEASAQPTADGQPMRLHLSLSWLPVGGISQL